MSQSALDSQQDGNHYKVLKVQPLEFAYWVHGSPCFTKLCKYASRIKVDRAGDLRKAIHCIQLEDELTLLADNPYVSLRVTERYFEAKLNEFTKDGFLQDAIRNMYWGRYAEAIISVETILSLEGLD